LWSTAFKHHKILNLLSWPKRLLQTTPGNLGGPSLQKWLLTLIDQGVVSATGFLATVIIGRACAKEQLGLYCLGLSLVGLVMELHNVLIWSPYTALNTRIKGSAHALYNGSTLVHQWSLSALTMLVLVGAGLFLSRGWGPAGLAPVVWMLALAVPFITFREYARCLCFAGLQIKTALWLDTGAALLQVSALLWLAFLGKLSAVNAFGVMGLGACLAGLLWLYGARRSMALSMAGVASDLGRNWSFGKWLLGCYLAYFLGCQTYPWILTGLHGLAVVAALAACQGVVGLVNPFMQGTTNFLAPRAARAFAQGGPSEVRAFVRKSTFAVAPVMALFCVGLMAFGSNLVTFIYGSQYAGFGLVIAILSLNILMEALTFGVALGIWAMGRPDLEFRIELVRLLTTLTLGLGLVQVFGLIGVAWGLLLGSIVVLIAKILIFHHLSRLDD
jgi:O-antigen/teichoic acid export membrane protein